MDDVRLWTGEVIDAKGDHRHVWAESFSAHEGTVSVVFPGVSTMPKHVTLKWNGGMILSLTDAKASMEKMDRGTPGRVIWENDSSKLYFIANLAELREVCASQTFENKFSADG